MNILQALNAGYKVDTTCYPHVAYKGPRFQPDEIKEVPTEKETALEYALQEVRGELVSISETLAMLIIQVDRSLPFKRAK